MTAPGTRPELGRPELTRVAGLPAAYCPLPSERTAELLDRHAGLSGALEELRPRVEDVLYTLVPLLDGARDLRRAVLAARRAAHRCAPPGWDEPTAARIAGYADEEACDALGRWQELTAAAQAVAEELDKEVARDRAAAEDTLAAALEDPAFAHSLALATPDWVRYGRARGSRKRQRALRTLYSYTVRAAAKTSPFARLTTVGVPGGAHDGRAVQQVSATVAFTALYALARSPRTAHLLRYRPAPVRPAAPAAEASDDPALLMLHPEYVATGGVTWRLDQVVEAGPAADWARALAAACTPAADMWAGGGGASGRGAGTSAEGDRTPVPGDGTPGHAERTLAHGDALRTLGGPDPFRRFLRMLDSGVLAPVPPWRRGEDALDALLALTRHLPDAEPPGAAEALVAGDTADGTDAADGFAAVGRLRALAAERERLAEPVRPGAEAPRRRAGAVARVRELGREWARTAGWDRFEPAEVWYEDAATGLRLPPVVADERTAEDLRRLGAAIRPRLFRSHLYDTLVRRFVAAYGSGGSCDDVLGFAMRCGAESDRDPELEQAVQLDLAAREDPGERAWLPVGPSSAPPTAAVLFQQLRGGPGAAADGGPRLVVNQFNPGTGGLLTRFKELLGGDFAEALRGHVRRCWPHAAHHRELVLWTECSTAQAQSCGLLPPLTLPGELGAADALPLDATRLVHDPRQDTLTLLAPDGLPLAAAYTGLVPTHLFPKFARFLAVLSDPWINGSPLSDHRMPFQLPRDPEQVRAQGRETLDGAGAVVTRRASWTVPVDRLPLPSPDAGCGAEGVAAMDAFRRAHGMPREMFAYLLPANGGGFGPDHDRKPLWIRLDSAVSLEVLAHWITPGTGHLRLVEALPAHDGHPLRDADGDRRAAEHAALLHWADTGEEEG
ncbi:hypothetical protein [Streptomyces qinglanensis]|uniref:Lantibiotic dehydratase, C terminus n=1 Tax=Streptomyces qinglanensis TaxID=943816 RepID=A0A1H9UD00_9ACTN|nr:hypothetical protein [Streptomyces qinglanensis]SES07450.1 hypothetical protein SAMN05421870_10889 [Streptomyces qinglanensis]